MIAGLCVIYSCKKKKGSSIAYNMKGTINNAEFSGTNAIALAGPDSILSIYGGYFEGSALNPPYIFIHLYPYRGIGVYNFAASPFGLTTVSYAAIDSTTFYSPNTVSVSGSVTITGTSPAITGTFAFTALDSTKASGSFVAKAP